MASLKVACRLQSPDELVTVFATMGNKVGKEDRVDSSCKVVEYHVDSESIRLDSPPILEAENEIQSSSQGENEPQKRVKRELSSILEVENESSSEGDNEPQKRVYRDLSSRRVVIRDYESNSVSELDLSFGDQLFNVKPAEERGWLFGAKHNGRCGYFPSRCVLPLKDPNEDLKLYRGQQIFEFSKIAL